MTQTFIVDHRGKKFGRLLVQEFVPTECNYTHWQCLCDCGEVVVKASHCLTGGRTRSCGCLHREYLMNQDCLRQSGKTSPRSGAYSSWANMMGRSGWMSHPGAKHYGEKGIRVDARWYKFDNFYADMGDRPKGYSIERIDNEKGYGPDNCKWATKKEQALNRKTTVKVVYQGRLVPVMSLTAKFGLSHLAVRGRAQRRGNDYVKALESFGINVGYP